MTVNKEKTEKPQSSSKDLETEMLSFRQRAKERMHKNFKETTAKLEQYEAQGMAPHQAWDALMAEPLHSTPDKANK